MAFKAKRLGQILKPTRVAFVGGSGLEPAIDYARSQGFQGEMICVSPKHRQIADVACVRSVADLPWVPDLALLVIPKEAVTDVVRDLAKIGCGGVICNTSGFSEAEGGEQRQTDLVTVAGDMPVIGPNCPGIANFLDNAAFMMDHFGNHARDQGVAVISNGGAYLSDLGCADRSQPIAYLLGLGNQAMVSVADMLDVVLDDPRVTAVNVYFEGINDVEKLSHAAAKAARMGVPVVAIKGGKSDAGARAAQSHTASLSGDAEIASALFRRFGWIEVTTTSEAIETLKMLSYSALPAGVRAGFVTSSGTYAVLGGDIADRVGLVMHPPTEKVEHTLNMLLPDYVGAANPLDISDAHGWPEDHQLPIYQAFMQDPTDVTVQVMCYPPKGGWDMTAWDATTQAMAKAKGSRPAAFVNTLADALPRAARERMISQGVAPLQGIEDGLRAVSQAAHYGVRRGTLKADELILPPVPTPGEILRYLDEAQAKSMLKTAGLHVPQHWVVQSCDDLPDIQPVCALKAIVPDLLHKADVGAVALNIAPADLGATIASMQTRLSDQDLVATGYLIEEMVPEPIGELLVGLRRVVGIGVVLTLGIGGSAVELLADTATLILPTSRPQIKDALAGLRLYPLISGHRGRPSTDLDVTLDAIEMLGHFVLQTPQIGELEINPLLLTETHAFIADAVLGTH